MRADTQNTITEIEKSLDLLAQRMDWDTAQHRLEEFNARVEDPDLWDDPEAAQKLMRDRQMLVDAMTTYTTIRQELRDNVELIELGEMEDDAEVVAEAEAALKALGQDRRRQGTRGAAGRRGRRQRHLSRDQRGRGRHRKLRLGGDAGADVCPLGRKEGLQGRAAVGKRG